MYMNSEDASQEVDNESGERKLNTWLASHEGRPVHENSRESQHNLLPECSGTEARKRRRSAEYDRKNDLERRSTLLPPWTGILALVRRAASRNNRAAGTVEKMRIGR